MADALEINDSLNLKATAVRFENPIAAGEYSLTDGLSLQDFEDWFGGLYGTEAQAVGLIVPVPYEQPTSDEASRGGDQVPDLLVPAEAPSVIPTDAETFTAPAAVGGEVEDIFDTDLPATETATSQALPSPYSDEGSGASPSSASYVPSGPPVGLSWAPSYMELRVERVSGRQYFYQFANWRGGTSPALLPQDFRCSAGGVCFVVKWGMEFQIDTFNYNFSSNVRPFCLPGQNESGFLATNESFTWGVSTGSTNVASATTAYIDNWEIEDACHKNSFGVGLRYPQNIPVNSNGFRQVLISINAPVGTQSSGHIVGSVTLNDDMRCQADPLILPTYCMGYDLQVPPAPWESARSTLAGWRNWYASPNKCWTSASWGMTAPAYVLPYDSDGCF